MRSEHLEREILRLGQCDTGHARLTYLYFVQAESSGAVKIGLADDPPSRLRELQVGNHETLRLAAAWRTRAGLERFVHRALAGTRIRGEWFHASKFIGELLDDLTFIYGEPTYSSLHSAADKMAETASLEAAQALSETVI